MSDLHALRVTAEKQALLEGVGPAFLKEGLLKARDRSWQAYQRIRESLREGMTEAEIHKMALELLKQLGSPKNWHRPYIRFGEGTLLTFNDPIRTDARLQNGDPVYVDIGPVWRDDATSLEYEGDVGDSFVFGTKPNADAEACAAKARQLFNEACLQWRDKKLTGETLYTWMNQRARELGYELMDVPQGHRLADFPHHKYTKEALAQQPFTPSADLWILEVQLKDSQGRFAAFFEDLLN